MARKITALAIVGLLVFAALAFAGGAKEAPEAAAAAVEPGNEAPMLAALVQSGELPPLAERIPENPYVVEPWDEIGRYGGTLRRSYSGTGDTEGIRKLSRVGLVEFSPDGSEIVPALAERYTMSDDGLTFTFHLRRGIRWSDGEPFTANDLEYGYRHELLNEELTPSVPSTWRVGGERIRFEMIDDYTFRYVLPGVSATFLQDLARDTEWGSGPPAHYMQQFHPDFADASDLEAMVRAENFDTWVQLYESKAHQWQNPERPSLRAWVMQDAIGAQTVRMERNPYYWRVDTAGNQLPYIDRVENRLMLDKESMILAIISGELDFQGRNVAWGDYPILMENRDRGNYNVLRWPTALGSAYAFMPNLNVPDPKLNELFNDRRFRIALSHAMDRDELNEVLFLGATKPRAATAVPGSTYYQEDLENLYAEFDPAKSEQLFQEIGLTRGSDGYWRHKDGSRLSVVLNAIQLDTYGSWPDLLEMVGEMWDQFGLRNEVIILDRSLYTQRYQAGEFEIGGWAWGRGFTPLIAPKFVFPSDSTWNPGPLFGTWYQTGGASGVEPPADHPVRKAMEMYDRYVTEPDVETRTQIGKDLIRLSAEEIWSIGTVGEFPDPHVASRRLRNVPQDLLSEHLMMTPSNARVEQFFFVD